MMDSSSIQGKEFDPSKCTSNMSMEEKRELVYQLSNCSNGTASEILQKWSRQEILQVLSNETGKERKLTGLTKLKIIENLLKVVSENKLLEQHESKPNIDSISQRANKRQRKADQPIPSNRESSSNNSETDIQDTLFCKNTACRARVSREDVFCKRCSCCICFQYDDNKDPSLWLTCSSEPPFEGDSCGLSCHLECALRREEQCAITKEGSDGIFFCISCKKANDLIRCWRKQLMTAKDTRRVDVLCYRISLSRKLLAGTKNYQKPYELVDEAVKNLEAEVGPLTGVPVKMGRAIVNRLSSGPLVQKLCSSALDSLDILLAKNMKVVRESNFVGFEDVSTTSLTVILGSEDSHSGDSISYALWHRRAEDTDYPTESTRIVTSKTKFTLFGLTPATEYVFKVVWSDNNKNLGTCEIQCRTVGEEMSQSPATNSSSLSNPSSVEDETNTNTIDDDCEVYYENATTCVSNDETGRAIKTNNKEGTSKVDLMPDHHHIDSQAVLPITPCRLEGGSNNNNVMARKGRKPDKKEIESGGGGGQDGNMELEQCVKVMRRLECEGHIDANFRRKFLTWYSLRATPRELKTVKVFIDTLFEDPPSLAGQLIDSFSDIVSGNRSSTFPSGFCLKLWH
ncbi:VIN3-like protein 2 [Impatiens glandulifera]|uniref:VIN3-like protein 2 n=1 Tax=Impatiens glandulifera TaxID=253017 RepID=UPI001FB18DEE|nr:VIN3-like protein 2 [Impatiens glandulifera]